MRRPLGAALLALVVAAAVGLLTRNRPTSGRKRAMQRTPPGRVIMSEVVQGLGLYVVAFVAPSIGAWTFVRYEVGRMFRDDPAIRSTTWRRERRFPRSLWRAALLASERSSACCPVARHSLDQRLWSRRTSPSSRRSDLGTVPSETMSGRRQCCRTYQRPWIALSRAFERRGDEARARASRQLAADWGAGIAGNPRM